MWWVARQEAASLESQVVSIPEQVVLLVCLWLESGLKHIAGHREPIVQGRESAPASAQWPSPHLLLYWPLWIP